MLVKKWSRTNCTDGLVISLFISDIKILHGLCVFQENFLKIRRINVLKSRCHWCPLKWHKLFFQWQTFTFQSTQYSQEILNCFGRHLVFSTQWQPKCLSNQSLIYFKTVQRPQLFDLDPVWILSTIYKKAENWPHLCCLGSHQNNIPFNHKALKG